MKKIILSLLCVTLGLGTFHTSCSTPTYIRNETPFPIHAYLSRKNLLDISVTAHKLDIAPGETGISENSSGTRIDGVYVTVFTHSIVPDTARSATEQTVPDKPTDKVEVYADSKSLGLYNNPQFFDYFIGSALSSYYPQHHYLRATTLVVRGPQCLNCPPKSSLFNYDEFKREYDNQWEQLQKAGKQKPKSYQELMAVSTPLIQQDRFWNMDEAHNLAKKNGKVVIPNDDPEKNIYYTYTAGQVTDITPGRYNDKTSTTRTFEVKSDAS